MSARVVKVFATGNDNIIEITTSARTWGELQNELRSQKNMDVSGMNAKVRSSKVTLEHKDAELPTGEFTIFVTPAKVKSGVKAKTKKVVVKRTTRKTSPKAAKARKSTKK